MSKRGRQSSGTISLFPFLAVLVCAMGALILLLLVTTRRIRQQTLAQSALAAAEKQPQPAPRALVPPVASPIPMPAIDSPAPPARDLSDEPILPLLASDPPKPTPDPAESLRNELAALEQEQARLEAVVSTRRAELAQIESAANSQSAALKSLHGESQSLTAERERLNLLYLRVLEQQQETEQRAQNIQQEIERARAQLAEADSKFAVIPYDGYSGTTRRPIIIECTEDSLTFASEGVTLTAADMDGFTVRFNPLLDATQGLIRYWQRRDLMNSEEDLGKPYVLLIVRPGGAAAYNIAHGMLTGLNQPFGYELVTDDQQFTWPESDLEATAICRMLVERRLAERDQLLEVAVNAGARLPSYCDEQGRFCIPGSEPAKGSTRDLVINGQHFSRNTSAHETPLPDRPPLVPPASTTPSLPHDPDPAETSRIVRRGPSHPGAESESVTNRLSPTGDPAFSSRVHTRQQTAVTRTDRMADWLRDGTARLSVSDNEDGTPLGMSPSEDLHPARPTLDSKTRSNKSSEVDPARPRWTRHSPGGMIGFDHEVSIRVSVAQVDVGDDLTFELTEPLTKSDLQRLLALAIDREIRSWGDPPRSFYWVPSVRFIVSPGGRQSHQRLKEIVEGWGLRSSVKYVAE